MSTSQINFLRELFIHRLMQMKAVILSSFNKVLNFVTTCAASENILSAGTDVADTHNISLAIKDKIGYTF